MPKKLSDDLMKTNQEYTKMKSGLPDDETPRENPDQQSPGRAGLHRPELDRWTKDELLDAAKKLNIDIDEGATSDELIDALMRAQRRRQ